MPRILLLLLIALVAALPAQAQDQLPDYRISVISSELSEDHTSINVSFGIINIGGTATNEATVILTIATTGVQLGIKPVQALDANESTVVDFSFPANTFPAGSVQSLQASVGIDEIEPRSAATIGNNTARIGINIPTDVVAPAATTETTAPGIPTRTPEGAPTAAGSNQFRIPNTDIVVDLNNPIHIGILMGIAGILLVLLWVLTVILRLIFHKTPTLGMWQPPYASMPMLDPNSTAGRRQLWQPHAQNDAVVGPCAEGNYHIRKLLVGTDGATLSGWRVTAMRMSQYDMYGRVARTQTLAPNGVVKRLDRAARKGRQWNEEKAYKQMRPVAGAIMSAFQKRWSKRNPGLPISLDIRLKGSHGDVRIMFELFGCTFGEWQVVDQWEPEMMVMHGEIQENFTYTFFGQRPGEENKVYRKRLQEELTRTLAQLVTRQRAPAALPAAIPVTRETPPVQQFVPQDTAPNPPVGG